MKPKKKKSLSQNEKPQMPLLIPSSRLTSESNKTGTWRYLMPRYYEKTAPCGATCPAGEDISRIEMLLAQGAFKEAWDTIRLENPLPSVCGRICHHPCERICNRRQFDAAVSIRTLERFAADTAERNDFRSEIGPKDKQKEKIAIIGAGPAGLAAAYFLARLGYGCTIFEAMPEPGGILRWALPRYRLPQTVLAKEIERIQALGVAIVCNQKISREFFASIVPSFDAFFMACGQWQTPMLHIPGEELPGVSQGFEFLHSIADNTAGGLQGSVAVIGGGNTALDVARSVKRLGGDPVIIYRRRRCDMPAFGEEIESALAEGVMILELCAPIRIDAGNNCLRLTLQQMKSLDDEDAGRARVVPDEGQTRSLDVTHVFKAIGFETVEPWHTPTEATGEKLKLNHIVLSRLPNGHPLAFGGDLTNSIKSVVHAVASGKEAAMAIDTWLKSGMNAIQTALSRAALAPGGALSMEKYMDGPRSLRSGHVVQYKEINIDYFEYVPRLTQPRLLQAERIRSFAEIDLKISANMAIREAERCFNCGLCNGCDNCRLYCPDLAVHLSGAPTERWIDYNYCKGCGICVVECPRNAMVLEEEEKQG